MLERSPTSLDEARLLPRVRVPSELLERRRLERRQAAALDAAIAAEPEGKPLPLRYELTKPGDPRQLRGIPAIGRGVGGAIRGTQPEQAATSDRAA